jgi:hypothetical protein
MLGRRNYARAEFDHGKTAVDQQLAAHKRLVMAVASAGPDKNVTSALEHFETRFFNNMALVLDRLYVHRLRMVPGKDGNPLNGVEMICDSLMNSDGVLRGNNVIRWIPERSVTRLRIGDTIRLTAGDFERLSSAFFTELERRFL